MTLTAAIESALGKDVASSRQLPGGDLGGAALVTLTDGQRVVAKQGALVEREGAMLRAIAATGAPAPAVLHCATELLIMEFIEANGKAGWISLADGLARLHAAQDKPYGWDADYAFGEVAIANAASANWPQFWAERRLLPFCPHFDPALAARIEALAENLRDHLPEAPPAALLHGDLWSGNVLFHDGRLAALIDPASYYGDREVDFAMLQVFAAPPAEFFDASELAPGWRERVPIYQLWPLLVHLQLFGGGYRSRVETLLSDCGV